MLTQLFNSIFAAESAADVEGPDVLADELTQK